MRTTTILLALMLVLGLALWAGTAAAAAPEKWTGAPETAVEEGRGGYATVEEGRIVSAPEKFDLTHELAPESVLTRGRVPCVPADGRGGQIYRMDFGEKWVF